MALIVIDVETSLERDVVEQDLHVGERVDRDPDATDLGGRLRMVRVVAHLRREVERYRQSGLPGVQQVPEALVGRLGAAETGVLAHGPQPIPVHPRVDAAGERVLAGSAHSRGEVGAR